MRSRLCLIRLVWLVVCIIRMKEIESGSVDLNVITAAVCGILIEIAGCYPGATRDWRTTTSELRKLQR